MRNSKTIITSLVGAAALMTTFGASLPAAAQTIPEQPINGPEHVLILLDMSGSMMREGLSVGTPRWRDAMSASQTWVQKYMDSADSGYEHHVAVWGFSEGAMTPLWPLVAGDCPNGTEDVISSREGSPVTTVCRMPDASAYPTLLAAFNENGSIDAFHPPELGGPRTNLAQGLCEMVAYVKSLPGNEWSIILEADGNENFTSIEDVCYGESAVLQADFELDTDVLDWGFQGTLPATVPTWQSKTMRAAARFVTPQASAVLDPLATGNAPGSEYCAFYGPNAATCDPEIAGSNLHWKVDSHQTACDAEGSDCSPWVYASGGTYPSLLAAFAAPGTALVEDPDAPNSFSFVAAPSLAAASFSPMAAASFSPMAAAVPSYPSLPFGEIGLFKTLASSTAKSTLTVYKRIEGTVYGRDHVLPADVDDSGCADQADLAIIMQDDVWMHRAVEPNQIAIRADIDRDGFVNNYDREMLLSAANWGEGCIQYPPHPEAGASCWNDSLDGDETDVDCGGADCLPCAGGGACLVDEDCANSPCVDGICGGGVVDCTADIAIDLGAPGTATTVDNASCLKVQKGLPFWWGTRGLLLQTRSGGTYPVPFSWVSECTGSSGTALFTGSWQSTVLRETSRDCVTLIQLEGAGGPVSLTYYGQ